MNTRPPGLLQEDGSRLILDTEKDYMLSKDGEKYYLENECPNPQWGPKEDEYDFFGGKHTIANEDGVYRCIQCYKVFNADEPNPGGNILQIELTPAKRLSRIKQLILWIKS